MRNALLVFLGSGLGGLARHLLSRHIDKLPHKLPFPVGILCVNILASFLIGLIAAAAASRLNLGEEHRLLLAVGFCGGFSTLSTLTHQSLGLWQGGQTAAAIAYILTTLVTCLAANALGFSLATKTL